ncbi:MAG: type IX secretion system membrane protein PorP/SprF [Flavobacteriales bacterium]|nr:type IX secretion system membrane protein PorP/SprF [Flavobacteriales bacterium]
MKNIIKLFVLICVVNTVSAQQIPLTSQYMFNDYLLNPAVAGTTDYLFATLSARSQWTGLDGAPETQFFSMHSKLGEKMGVGGYVYNDETGPISERGIQLSYAYHLKVSDKSNLSFSLAGMLFFHNINRAYLKPEEGDDAALTQLKVNAVSPDINFGVLYYTEKLKLGLSSPQLLQNNIYGATEGSQTLNQLARHYYLFGEYKFPINDKFTVVPSTLLKYVQGSPMQFDLNVRAVYNKKYWIGASYRYDNAIVALIGLSYKKFSFGYSYDYSSTDIKDYSSGGHEIFLSIKLFEKEEQKSRTRFN